MVNDVAYDSLKIPGFITSMVMKVLSKQIQSKVHFDILKLKPAEFAKTCTVPCVFIIGKEDKLVYPKRVQEIFDAYQGKQKTLINSSGDHSSEREPHILKQCFGFILQTFKKNCMQNRVSIPQTLKFYDNCSDSKMSFFANHFKQNYEHAFRSGSGKNSGLYHSHNGRFNFDVYLDESRNEENIIRYEDQDGNEANRKRVRGSRPDFGKEGFNEFSDEELLEELTNLQLDADMSVYPKDQYQSHIQEFSQFIKANHL